MEACPSPALKWNLAFNFVPWKQDTPVLALRIDGYQCDESNLFTLNRFEYLNHPAETLL